MKKKLLFIFCFLLVIGGTFSNSSQIMALEDTISIEDIDVEYMENQIESVSQYQKMLESFNAGEKTRSVHEQLYDDNYGGSYIDDNGELVVLLVENSDYGISAIEQATGSDDVQTIKCQHSFNELITVIEIINENLDYLIENDVVITEMYEDVYSNTVKITVLELDEAKEKMIRQIVDSPCMEIIGSDDFSSLEEIDIKGGFKITSNDNNRNSTLGFCATKNGNEGFVIAGHAGDKIDESFSYNSWIIGEVLTTTFTKSSAYADAAFLEKTSDADTTYDIGGYACRTLAESVSDYPVGMVIYKYGISTGTTSGKILSNYCTTTIDMNDDDVVDMTLTNQTKADYESADGDSGCPVYTIGSMYNGRMTCKLLGIHSGSVSTGKVFSKYYLIEQELGITAITY